MIKTPSSTKYFALRSLPIIISACAALFACKPGGETAQVVVLPPIYLGASADLRALLVNEDNNCLYVADYNQKLIHCVDLTTHSINQLKELSTPGKPITMSIARDATALIVATEGASTASTVEVITLATKSSQTCTLSGIPNSLAVTGKNQIYVGVGIAQTPIYACGTVAAPTQTATPVTQLNTYSRIAGLSNDGTLMLVVGNDTKASLVLTESLNTTSTQDLFGKSEKYGWVVFHPKNREAYVLTDGTATDGNFLPTYSIDGMTRQLNLITSPLQPAFIPTSLALLQTPQRAVMAHASERLFWAPNQHNQTDLHVFDTDTGEELGRYDVGDYVRKNSLAVDQRNSIYMLLGETQASHVGIVTAP